MARKLKVSKNRKKTWRKHVDIKEVDRFLEEQRFNQRIGGSISEKPDEQIFVIEKTGQPDADKKAKKAKEKTVGKASLKEIKSNLKLLKKLEPASKVPAIPSKTGPKDTRKSFLEDDKRFPKRWAQMKNGIEKFKEISADRKAQRLGKFEVYDLWGDDASDNNHECKDEELEELEDVQQTLVGKKPPKVRAQRHKKASLLPHVEVPHPGASYNPSFEDHQNLLDQANQVEMKKIKEERHLSRVLDEMFPTVDEAPNEMTWLKEMSQGLANDEEAREKEINEKGLTENESTCESLSASKKARRSEKKTKAKRNKELVSKNLETTKKLKKVKRLRDNQFFKLKALKKEIEDAEKKTLERRKRREQKEAERLFKPHTLSRHKYEDPELEINLSEELSGNLRSLKVEGNLLKDRFKSLQRRNIIEVRSIQQKKRKYKLKTFERRKRD